MSSLPDGQTHFPERSKELFLQVLHQFQQQDLLCDTTLVAADGQEVHGHAAVLAAASPALQFRLSKSKPGRYLIITSLALPTLQGLVYAMYADKLMPGSIFDSEMKKSLEFVQVFPTAYGPQGQEAHEMWAYTMWARLRQFQEQSFLCDTTLTCCQDHQIPVHGCVLAAFSSLVYGQLLETLTWPGPVQICLDSPSHSLQDLVSSLYNHRFILEADHPLYTFLCIDLGTNVTNGTYTFQDIKSPFILQSSISCLEGMTSSHVQSEFPLVKYDGVDHHSCYIYDLAFPDPHIPLQRKGFSCRKCGESFQDKNEQLRHKRKMHPVPDNHRKHKCQYCTKAYHSKRDCIVHERCHTGVKPFKCHFCERTYQHKSHMKRHERSHTGIKPYICCFCLKGFNSLPEMTSHERVHTGERPYRCPHCDNAFTASNALARHILTHTGVKDFMCHRCGKAFATKDGLELHSRSHTDVRPYSCKFCEKKFRSAAHTKRHERLHTNRTMYPCRLCTKEFTTNSNRHIHELNHSDEKPYQCAYCDKAFKTSRYVMDHERTHTGSKPYKCPHCDKKFAVSSARSRHVKSHTGVKPHKCSKCQKGFATKSHLRRHEGTCKH